MCRFNFGIEISPLAQIALFSSNIIESRFTKIPKVSSLESLSFFVKDDLEVSKFPFMSTVI